MTSALSLVWQSAAAVFTEQRLVLSARSNFGMGARQRHPGAEAQSLRPLRRRAYHLESALVCKHQPVQRGHITLVGDSALHDVPALAAQRLVSLTLRWATQISLQV